MTRKLSKKDKQKLELGIIVSAGILSILLWDTILIYPVKLFVVLLHEISHGIAAIISGGNIVAINLNYNLGGQCVTKNGNEILIASFGYLGSLLFGTLIFISGYEKKLIKPVPISIAVLIVLFMANFMRGAEGIVFTLLIAVILIISPNLSNKKVHAYIMKILGLVSCMYVLVDIKEDLLTLTYRETDAQLIAGITGIPALWWGLLWFVISIMVIYILLKHSYKKGFSFV
ncbi:MAG: M50 family metallopeptidase [Melioribacteraceae bacterium]|nr:M50 family metallopeptidase [Melioribacteraceae bacterium]MCF8420963.1 M50 family metallopeptidase [Melioribacteraceae bacterium]